MPNGYGRLRWGWMTIVCRLDFEAIDQLQYEAGWWKLKPRIFVNSFSTLTWKHFSSLSKFPSCCWSWFWVQLFLTIFSRFENATSNSVCWSNAGYCLKLVHHFVNCLCQFFHFTLPFTCHISERVVPPMLLKIQFWYWLIFSWEVHLTRP